ncbi:MAG: amino acid adenylation domain-containing protein [Opitutaceae bacterium]|nr:amino acid adenylation domain-containing protein [Opitutaceae bacterium]
MTYTGGEMVQEKIVLPGGGADCYPLSPLQQGMLYHRLDAGSTAVDLEQITCELHESIDPEKFRQAWAQVSARHEILRTGFLLENGAEPRQVVQAPEETPLEFRYEEFGGERELRVALEDFLAADRRRGFPTLTEPLIRIALFRGGPACFWFVTTFHHLLLDGRALVVMFREALDLHDALVGGRRLDLPAPAPYRRYIDWLQTLDWSRAESFWRGYLKGVTAPTMLPIARPTAAVMDDVAARGELAFRLRAAVTTQLRIAATQHNVTLNTMVQAAWAIVLSRYTAETDVVFGAVRACRHIPVDGAAAIVGLFINTVPVRVRVNPDAPLGPWLRELREQWVAFRDHEHTPLMKAQQWSEVAPGRALFETLFNYQEPSWDTALRMLGGKWERRNFDIISQPNYPLAVDAYGGEHITIKMLYDRRRFADDAIGRLLGHYRVTLEALAGAPERTVGELPLLTAAEQEQLFVAWNRTAMEYPRNVCVHTFVEQYAAASADRVAVSDTSTTLTYGELNRRAGVLAARLKTHRVGRGSIVAVCLERSTELIVAWLGVLKAGAAFCPLDPTYPAERLAFMLEDSGAPVVVTQRHLVRQVPTHAAVTICIDGEESGGPAVGGARDAGANRGRERPNADRLAYVIYTSGSTGQPKGVPITHRALMNLVTWHQRTFGVTPDDRATQVASPAFDAAVWEIWPYLATGASVHIPDEDTRISLAALWRWMAEKKITIAFLPTPLVEAAMNEPWPQGMALRTLLTGGDKLKRRPPADFPCRLINNYGPTESTVVATSGPADGQPGGGITPTIGRPIANTRVFVLDRLLRPVPAGVPGELFITGESLSGGYLRRPELTAEKFISLPPSADLPRPVCHLLDDKRGETRVYRTGDLVRWTTAGELEFLGRLDGQVKIRGCRIELGEIEAVLNRHPGIREGLVLVRPDERQQPQLVAYVVPATPPATGHVARDIGIQEVELMTFLRGKLPSYMVPAALVFLESWPLTPNGKIDRNSLPAPAVRRTDAAGAAAVPASPTEQTVARVWADILGRSSIGRHDNFFDLGGHSLLAAQVVSRLNQALETTLSVRAIFDQPTVAGLARELEMRRQQPAAAPRITSNRLKRRTARTEEILQPN